MQKLLNNIVMLTATLDLYGHLQWLTQNGTVQLTAKCQVSLNSVLLQCQRMLSIISRHFKHKMLLRVLIDNSEAKTKPNEADVWRSRAQHFAKVPQNARVFQFLFVLSSPSPSSSSFVAGGRHQVNSNSHTFIYVFARFILDHVVLSKYLIIVMQTKINNFIQSNKLSQTSRTKIKRTNWIRKKTETNANIKTNKTKLKLS